MVLSKAFVGGQAPAASMILPVWTGAARRLGSVRRWWIDYCARAAMEQAEAHILAEAGYRRCGDGRLVNNR